MNLNPFRTPATVEPEPKPTFRERVVAFDKRHAMVFPGFIVAALFSLLIFVVFSAMDCGDKYDARKRKEYNDRMGKFCGEDHFASEKSIAIGLNQITCISSSGETRFVYQETK